MGPSLQEALVARDADDSFAEFVGARSAYLFRLALLLTDHNRAEAEDLLQLSLERAYRRRARLTRDRSPESYVRQVLVNAAIDRRRRVSRRAEQPLDEGRHDRAVDDQTAELANRDLLVRSLGLLPPRQRAVLVLRYWGDLSEAEIAATLGCSVGTVKSQVSRGLARLRELAAIPGVKAVPSRGRGQRNE